MKDYKKRKILMSRAQIIALGFAGVIVVGAILLMFPIASKDGQFTSFLDALFTSTSATCVTGLVIADTFTKWTLFGQIVILCLIQVGGLGVITITGMMYIFIRKQFSLNMRGLIQDTIFEENYRDSREQIFRIIKRVLFIEGVGAGLLMTQFIPYFGPLRGIYYGIFHSVSIFCNAGFDLMGIIKPYSSFCFWAGNPVVIYTSVVLTVLGGLGFIVWDDILEKKFRFRKFTLHTKIVLLATLAIMLLGVVVFMMFEYNGAFRGMSIFDKFNNALFASASPRTNGMSTVDINDFSQGSKMLTCIFMFIGGNSGSTAGGIKLTTMVVMLSYIFCHIFGTGAVHLGKRRIDTDNINRAALVFGLNVILIATTIVIVAALQPVELDALLIEIFSAVGTVGLSAGLTRQLVPASLVVIMLLMFIGRIGTVTFALSFKNRKNRAMLTYPVENVNVG